MKKTFFGVFAAVMVFLLGSTTVFAAGPGCGRYFADADGDGICDNAGSIYVYEDADGDGVSDIPEAYASAQGRKVVEDSRSIGDLIKSPNKFAFIILGILLLLLVLIVLLFWLLIRLTRRNHATAGSCR